MLEVELRHQIGVLEDAAEEHWHVLHCQNEPESSELSDTARSISTGIESSFHSRCYYNHYHDLVRSYRLHRTRLNY